jgi:tRNA threonylcarbamoyladenosine biosynthesis protein TsaB
VHILALETSSDRGSVALLENSQPILELELPAGQRSAQSLVPTLDQIFAQAGWTLASLDLIAVTVGPGSFTGLRVGVTTAKSLAYLRQLPVAPINTLDVIAAQAPSSLAHVVCVMDAQRQQLFVRHYHRTPQAPLSSDSPVAIVNTNSWLESLAGPVAVSGPVLAKLQQHLPDHVSTVPPDLWVPHATAVGQLGYLAHQASATIDHWHLVPEYYRQSAAEEKRAAT